MREVFPATFTLCVIVVILANGRNFKDDFGSRDNSLGKKKSKKQKSNGVANDEVSPANSDDDFEQPGEEKVKGKGKKVGGVSGSVMYPNNSQKL